jgi:RNA polymerase sigma factor (sigma-70 family)
LTELLMHARAVLGRWLADRPATERSESAREAVNEVTIRALEKRVEYDANAGAVAAWLHGFMNNVLLNTARALRRRPKQPPGDQAAWDRLATELSPAAAETASDRLDAVGILSRLTVDQRTILELRYSEGLEHADIATRLGISSVCARVRVCRALAAAKAVAGVNPGEDGP